MTQEMKVRLKVLPDLPTLDKGLDSLETLLEETFDRIVDKDGLAGAQAFLVDATTWVAAYGKPAAATKAVATAKKSPIDSAMDRLRAALDNAARSVGDDQLAKRLDSFTATLKPKTGGSVSGTDTVRPAAAKPKEKAMAQDSLDVFTDSLFPGLRKQ